MVAANSRHIAAMAAAFAMLAFPAVAEMVHYKADLSAQTEVPPNDSTATGSADVSIDTDAKTVSWTVTYDGLTGDATAAHIHGPASETENAAPMIVLDPIDKGTAEITDEQMSDVKAGKTYVNVHTEMHPDGEIRGQLMEAK